MALHQRRSQVPISTVQPLRPVRLEGKNASDLLVLRGQCTNHIATQAPSERMVSSKTGLKLDDLLDNG